LLSPWIRTVPVGNTHERTCTAYQIVCLLHRSHRNCARNGSMPSQFDDLSADVIKAFLTELERVRRCTVGTPIRDSAAIHCAGPFHCERSPDMCSGGPDPKHPLQRCENSITYLEKKNRCPLEVPDQSTRLGHRDYALLLSLQPGARASEAVRVTIEDLERNHDGTGSVKLHGKGRKSLLPTMARTMTELLPLTRGRAGDPICSS